MLSQNAYLAYARYQAAADAARARYIETHAAVWSHIATACVSLSLTESRAYPECR